MIMTLHHDGAVLQKITYCLVTKRSPVPDKLSHSFSATDERFVTKQGVLGLANKAKYTSNKIQSSAINPPQSDQNSR